MWPRIQNGGRLFKLVFSSFVDGGKLKNSKLWYAFHRLKLRYRNYQPIINEVNHWAKSIIKQPILGIVYKTTVYTLVNRRIIHQKQQISAKKGDITQQYIDTSAMSRCVIATYFLYLISHTDVHFVGHGDGRPHLGSNFQKKPQKGPS